MKKAILVSISILILFAVFGGGCSCKKTPLPEPPEQTDPVPEPTYETEIPVVPPSDPVQTFDLRTVFFDYNDYGLTSEAKAILTDNASQLMSNPDVFVLIEGHCDARGTEQYNLSLGQKRADAVKSFLVNYGIEDARVTTISYGEERLNCDDETEQCWARNRRAMFLTKK